jgi:hypothetical protein
MLGGRAKGVKRPDVGLKISAAKRGHKTSPEARAKMAKAKRKYEPARPDCVRCGSQVKPKRKGLEGVPNEVIAELGLDLIPGSIVVAGGARFCDKCCDASKIMIWLWENERERFQRGDGPLEFTCDVCGVRPVERWPSQVEQRDAGSYRFRCSVCDPILRRYLMAARRAVDHLDPGLSWSASDLVELDAVAARYHDEMVEHWPATRRGQRPAFGESLVVEALFERGFANPQIAKLRSCAEKTVETRRHRARIRRRGLGLHDGMLQFAAD